jgi:hypothetical protein
MGAQQSQLGTKEEEKSGFLQRFLPSRKQFEPLPIPEIIDLNFILENRPTLPQNLQIQRNQNQLEIAAKILEYNNGEWNFGNLKENSQKLMNEVTYKLFLNFVKSKIVPNATEFKLPVTINSSTKESFEKNKDIINQISRSGIPEVNKFFSVKLSDLFPEIQGLKDNQDIIYVTLLGLAAIIGAEHLVIYFLMCGADPSSTYNSENEDTGTLMLLYQIGLSKIKSPPKYFIILARMLYILFLLGSVGTGIDLSNLFKSNFKIEKRNQGPTQVTNSILNELVKMPYTPMTLDNNNNSLITIQNGASIPLLFKIIEKNKRGINGLALWSNINVRDSPLGYTVLYSLLMNSFIKSKIKLSLVWYLIDVDADPLIIPNIRQNSQITKSLFAKENQMQIQLLFALLQNSNHQIFGDLLKILSRNHKFKQIYDDYKITVPGINQAKNMTIQRLVKNNEKLKKILLEVEKQKIIQLNSAIKESALIGSIRQNKLINQIYPNPAQNPAQNTVRTSIQNPVQNLAKKRIQNGGDKKKTMRTFYLLKHKDYYEYPFESERPISAAHNAYDFLKIHDKIGKKQIVLTIYDIANKKKYKYIAKTLKDGKNVLKSYK